MRSGLFAVALAIAFRSSSVTSFSLDLPEGTVTVPFPASASHEDSTNLRMKSVYSAPRERFTNIQKRSPEAFDVCFQRTVADRGNYDENGYRDPATWWEAPEWYVWVNATCVFPGFSRKAEVFCRQVRHLGLRHNGIPFMQPAECAEETPICEDTRSELDPDRPTGNLLPDVTCVTIADAKAIYVTVDREEKSWCSEAMPLAAHPSRIGSSYKLTMELRSGRNKGIVEKSETWFEVVASWWRHSHRLADRVGHVTTAIINTAPALGKTYVRFCALLSADTKSYVLPRVAIIYSASLIGKHREIRPPGGPRADTANVLNVEEAPEESIVAS